MVNFDSVDGEVEEQGDKKEGMLLRKLRLSFVQVERMAREVSH